MTFVDKKLSTFLLKKWHLDFLFEFNSTTKSGFNMQYLHIIIVSSAVKASSLCRAHHNELL